ncbi:hypothetical protein EDD86DRAFT_206994 [Gorgonomyces haynaldii]|nr:hypothetical protein EDD86DRAFT_206994 [Gorgonomyces haynaldii]
MDSLIAKFKDLSLALEKLEHKEPESFQEWAGILSSNGIVPLKTLVLKASKSTVPIVVVSLESTPFQISQVGKTLGLKEARVANEQFVKELFSIEKLDVNPLIVSLQEEVTLLVDHLVLEQPKIGFRLSGTESAFVSGQDLKQYFEKYQGTYSAMDFSQLGAAKPVEKKKEEKPKKEEKQSDEKEVQIGLTVKKDEDFSLWYSQVLLRTEMMDYYDISGCYIIRPWAYAIWKEIQKFFGGEIEELGVEDCYFPMFVSERSLNKEKDHIEGFSPEVAWVTKAGQSDLAEPIAVRPTSETVMYPYYSNWIRSHRDLPLRLNQWCNVVRWEFKHAQPFLRTREFLWQEGHTAFATKEESDKEVLEILELYRRVYEELLAVPVVPGVKSEKEKFAGGLYTTTVEGFIPTTGRAIQGATSHCLGQNFSKMFNILIDSETGEGARSNVWQNSWGLTTRTIGVMVMVHGDDKGLVLPPRVASVQVVIVPLGAAAKNVELRDSLNKKAQELQQQLKTKGVRAKADLRDNYTAGYKFNHWELRGVPLRIEVGPRDLAKNEVRVVRRDNGQAQQVSLDALEQAIPTLLETVQKDMFQKAYEARQKQNVILESWDGFVDALNKKCTVLAPWCERVECEEEVKERSARTDSDEEVDERAPSMGAKTLCIPFKQPQAVKDGQKCFQCEHPAKRYCLWGRSY